MLNPWHCISTIVLLTFRLMQLKKNTQSLVFSVPFIFQYFQNVSDKKDVDSPNMSKYRFTKGLIDVPYCTDIGPNEARSRYRLP